jgi:hypothetical protein
MAAAAAMGCGMKRLASFARSANLAIGEIEVSRCVAANPGCRRAFSPPGGMKGRLQARLPATRSAAGRITANSAASGVRRLDSAGKSACATVLRLIVPALLLALSAPAATFYVTISGLGGEPDYDQRFKGWANDIDSSLKKAGGDSNVITMIAPTREQIRARFETIARDAKPSDALVVMLIGHGTYDGVEYKFNIPGPDISGLELAALLDKVPANRQLVMNATSCSGASIEFLRKPNRVVIAATKTGNEKNATVFARFWAEALRDPAADVDKNESVSALEAFHYAQKKTKEFFDTQKRLSTEHSVLEDTGKGSGVATTGNGPDPDTGEGKLASTFAVVRLGANAAAAKDPAKKALLDQKEQIETAIDELKYQKAGMAADDYKKQLTRLLLELSRIQVEIDK